MLRKYKKLKGEQNLIKRIFLNPSRAKQITRLSDLALSEAATPKQILEAINQIRKEFTHETRHLGPSLMGKLIYEFVTNPIYNDILSPIPDKQDNRPVNR